MTLDLPTLERPRKAISGNEGGGKCAASVAAVMKRAKILIGSRKTFRDLVSPKAILSFPTGGCK
jgi:hypothetical protein